MGGGKGRVLCLYSRKLFLIRRAIPGHRERAMTGKGATSRRAQWITMRGAMVLLLPLLGHSAPEKDVIFEPTPMPIVRAMLALAKVGPPDVVYDFGSGDGRIPMTAAK